MFRGDHLDYEEPVHQNEIVRSVAKKNTMVAFVVVSMSSTEKYPVSFPFSILSPKKKRKSQKGFLLRN